MKKWDNMQFRAKKEKGLKDPEAAGEVGIGVDEGPEEAVHPRVEVPGQRGGLVMEDAWSGSERKERPRGEGDMPPRRGYLYRSGYSRTLQSLATGGNAV